MQAGLEAAKLFVFVCGLCAIMDGLAKSLERSSIIRKRFRKSGEAWIREPPKCRGANPLRTTAALSMNADLLTRVLLHMRTAKLPVALLEDEAPCVLVTLADICMVGAFCLPNLMALLGDAAL